MMRNAMRLTNWNCAPGKNIAQCLSWTAPLDADLLTLQECKRPAGNDPLVIWRGANTKQGAAVISRRSDLKLEPLDIPSLHRTVVPAVVHGPTPFLFVGVWTHEPFIEVAQASMTACVAAANGRPVVAAGDFNISPKVTGQERKSHRFLDWMRDELGLVSAYHQFFGETLGEETRATYYFQWKESKPFHLDYCFVPKSWSSRISSVEVGTYAEWRWTRDNRPLSDHCPLTVELRDSSAN